jgi:hypothetical protein
MFALHEPSRVCDKCFREVPSENEFVEFHLPTLRAGHKFNKRGDFLHLFSVTPGVLQLSRIGDALLFTEDKSKLSHHISLATIAEAQKRSADVPTWVIIDEDGKEIKFESDDTDACLKWISATEQAAKRTKTPCISSVISSERDKRKVEADKRQSMLALFESNEKRREANAQKREDLAAKYSFLGR